jgi:hypothetical protein
LVIAAQINITTSIAKLDLLEIFIVSPFKKSYSNFTNFNFYLSGMQYLKICSVF